MKLAAPLLRIALLLSATFASAQTTISVLDESFPGSEKTLAQQIVQTLKNQGFKAKSIDSSALEKIPAQQSSVLVVPDCSSFPMPSGPAFFDFLSKGGRALFIGGPPFQKTVIKANGVWTELSILLAQTKTEKFFFDFSQEDVTQWKRATGNPQTESKLELSKEAPPGLNSSLKLSVPLFKKWDLFVSPTPKTGFPSDASLTTFWARARNPKTNKLSVEWEEADGSRWIAVVDLSTNWKRYTLLPIDFKTWPSSNKQRGKPGDLLRLTKIKHLKIGFADSHTHSIGEGPHEVFIAGLGPAAIPAELPKMFEPPIIEMLWPEYKNYPLKEVSMAFAATPQLWLPSTFQLSGNFGVISPALREQGGYVWKKDCPRWVPLAWAGEKPGQKRGALGSLHFAGSKTAPDPAWGWIGVTNQRYLADNYKKIEPLIQAAVRGLTSPRLIQAGAEDFSYAEGKPIQMLLRAENPTTKVIRAEVRWSILSEKDKEVAALKNQPLEIPAASFASAKAYRTFEKLPAGFYRARVELIIDGENVDAITQDFSIWQPRPAAKAEDFITAHDGQFWLGGKPWAPHSVNYYPLYVSGTEPEKYWEHWTHPTHYMPQYIEKDLEQIQSLGITAICCSIGNKTEEPALERARIAVFRDFLARCERRGLKVNFFLRGADFRIYEPDFSKRLIEQLELANFPTVWTYDIAWEPRFGDFKKRSSYDADWAKWIDQQYGSLKAAEQDWGVPAPRANGKPTSPSDRELTTEGPHQKLVAAYRRFADDFISQNYGRSVRMIHTLDPHHLIGVRSGYGGNGNENNDPQMPFDLLSGAKHLDYISPEGYGIKDEWKNFERDGFTTSYARWAGGGKPVYWAEFGIGGYPKTAQMLALDGEFYENFLKMVFVTRAQGSAAWWWPGGYRVGEKSDYGIIDWDHTPRPAALAIQRWAPKFLVVPVPSTSSNSILIDRDLHPRGYSKILAKFQDRFAEALEQGTVLAVATEATGKSSLNVPLIAVGNTAYNGFNPPKYLNAEFNSVRLRVGEKGSWVELKDGDTISVKAGESLWLTASIDNTGEASWAGTSTAGGKPGAVFLAAGQRGGLSFAQPIGHNVARYADTELEAFSFSPGITKKESVTLAMQAKDRAWFGQRLSFKLKPAP